MKRGQREDLATPSAVIADHGGDAAFWLSWIHGDLAGEVQEWIRQQAGRDDTLAADVRSVEQPDGSGYSTQAAREIVGSALEANGYLAPPEAKSEGAGLTPLVHGSTGAATATSGRIRDLVRPALFDLLERELDIEVPGPGQAAEASRLLLHLVGPDAVRRFRRLSQDVEFIHTQATTKHPVALHRALGALLPQLFTGSRPPQLSFRLFLRARLKQFCRQQGWQPRSKTLDAAFKDLSRERIGEVIEQAAAVVEQGDFREGLQLVAADAT